MAVDKLFRKLAAINNGVKKRAKFDKINIADDIRARSPLAKRAISDNSRTMEEITGSDAALLPEEQDVNKQATLSLQEFVFTAQDANPSGNLITMEIIADSAESVEVEDQHIKVYIDDGVSDHDSVKALIDGDDQASSLISVAINAGEGATVVVAADTAEFSGAL